MTEVEVIDDEFLVAFNPPNDVFADFVHLVSTTEGWAFQENDYEIWKSSYPKHWMFMVQQRETDRYVASISLAKSELRDGSPLFSVAFFYCLSEFRSKGFGKIIFDKIHSIYGDHNCTLFGVGTMWQWYEKRYGFRHLQPYFHCSAVIPCEKLRIPKLLEIEGVRIEDVIVDQAFEYDKRICEMKRGRVIKSWLSSDGVHSKMALDSNDNCVGYGAVREAEPSQFLPERVVRYKMVRRGGRAAAPVTAGNNSSTSSSNGSNQNASRWSRSRPASANSSEIGGAKGAKSFDSSRSSPNGSSQSTSSSPPVVKKGQDRSGKGARSSSHWRSRGSASGRSNTGAAAGDSKFSITNEDFPALPGARGGVSSQLTPTKGQKREKDVSGRHGSTNFNADQSVTDDSGVSSSSRGHTPIQDSSISPIAASPNVKTSIVEKKKPVVLPVENPKRKTTPTERERPPRSGPKSVRPIIQAPFGSASPKKKSINAANAANTAPSFMKLSKLGQKIPERRGGTRTSNQSPLSVCPLSPSGEDSGKENEDKFRELRTTVIDVPNPGILSQEFVIETRPDLKRETSPNIYPLSIPPPPLKAHVPRTDVPKIILGPDGEMSNIPSTMLTDQFGMAAMLPILEIVKNKNNVLDQSELAEDAMRKKVLNENIEMVSVGIDLNELGVPIKTADHKTVWQSFAGPFGHQPLAPTSMGLSYYQVPSVYYTARTLQSSFDMTQNIPDKFGVHELFYIFYNLPKELWQINAARELQYRGWRFNIKERLWVHKKLHEEDYSMNAQSPQNPFTQPASNQDDVMVGTFEIYDAEKARIASRDMRLRRSDFEVPAWEQRTLDSYQKMITTVFPKEVLWGPREDRSKMALIPGMAGLVSAGAGRARGNKLANLVIPKQQPSARRLLSFADSPDLTPSFDSPFGTLPGPAATSEDLYRQQMYSVILQKMQMQQQTQFHQQRPAAAQNSLSSSSSSSTYFQS